MEVVKVSFMLLGALGVFLFGMKIMSEGLQKVAGSRLKAILGRMTSNRLSGVLTGFGVTCVVQSSSATTVMVVGFVSAGLLTLTQSIGVIMGANIGTTVTGWLVALLGFKIKITLFALPAVGIGFFMGFIKNPKVQHWGEVILGFGLLFLGISLLKDAIPAVDDPKDLAWITMLTGHGIVSVLGFILLGTLLTIVLQSSSATMTLTLTLAAFGWLPYDLAAAMVLGENIGTTATANIAAIGAPTAAVRAARVHLLFNVVGVVWAVALMYPVLLPTVDLLVPGDPMTSVATISGDEGKLVWAGIVTTHLAAFHTVFNIVNTAIMLPFATFLGKLATAWVKDREKPGRTKLRYLSTAIVATPELSIIEAGREMQHMVELVREMYSRALLIIAGGNEKMDAMVAEATELEDTVDDLEDQIVSHLGRTSQETMAASAAAEINLMVQNTHGLERIGDHCLVLVKIAQRTYEAGREFSEDDLDNMNLLSGLVDESLEALGSYLAGEGDALRSEELEAKIDKTRRKLRKRRIKALRKDEDHSTDIRVHLAFLDLITQMEEIGDRAVGIVRRAEAGPG